METLNVFLNVYAGKTVLVTGHTGFKGVWLSIWLTKLGAKVVGYALCPSTDPNLFDACQLSNKVNHIEADIRNRDRVREVIDQYRPDFIFHLAAQPLVRDSYANPYDTFDINVMGTIALLDVLHTLDHQCTVIIVSTDKCYQNKEWEYGYREIDMLGGHDPYSASKAAMEIALSAYRSSFFATESQSSGVRIASVRAGNVIGGGDWSKDRIIPDAVKALVCNQPIIVRNPGAVRPWQHVLEPLSGYLWLAARLYASSDERLAAAWNFGPRPTDIRSVVELIDIFIAQWGSGSCHTPENTYAPHEASILKLSIDKAYTQLGWEPVWDIQEAVKQTSFWYRAFYNRFDNIEAIYQLCLDTIALYECSAQEMRRIWIS